MVPDGDDPALELEQQDLTEEEIAQIDLLNEYQYEEEIDGSSTN